MSCFDSHLKTIVLHDISRKMWYYLGTYLKNGIIKKHGFTMIPSPKKQHYITCPCHKKIQFITMFWTYTKVVFFGLGTIVIPQVHYGNTILFEYESR